MPLQLDMTIRDPQFFYTREPDGRYLFHRPGPGAPHAGVAVVFDCDPAMSGCCMLKHGPPEAVRTWWDGVRTKVGAVGVGAADLMEHWKYVEGDLDVDELNRAIACPGYRPCFLKGA